MPEEKKTNQADVKSETESTPYMPGDPESPRQDATLVDPERVNSSESRVQRVANKAAGKAVRREQQDDKRYTTFTN